MVLRKPLPPAALPPADDDSDPSADAPLPYPVTPTTPRQDPFADPEDREQVQEDGDHSPGPERDGRPHDAIPPLLRPGPSNLAVPQPKDDRAIPTSLRVGPPGGSPRTSQDGSRPGSARSQSPRTPVPGASSTFSYHPQSSTYPYGTSAPATPEPPGSVDHGTTAWADSKVAAGQVPPSRSLADMAATLSMNEEPDSDNEHRPRRRQASYQVESQDSAKEVVTPPLLTGRPPPIPSDSDGWNQQPPLIPVATERPSTAGTPQSAASDSTAQTESSAGWDPGADISTFDAFTSRSQGLPDVRESAEHHPTGQRSWQEEKVWEQAERQRRDAEAAIALERAQQTERERRAEEEWHKGEEEALRSAEATAARVGAHPDAQQQPAPPPPPPRPPHDLGKPDVSGPQRGPVQPLNVTTTSRVGVTAADQADSPATRNRKQTSETYQIKHINWDDGTSAQPRRSPILVQNANGPCPLLALVNALTLSTPAHETTALVETLRVREQVSLGLLLDAVFDELMSGRRQGGQAARDHLPDVADLYAFLVTLHSGMNVNPCFLPKQAPPPNLMDGEALPVSDAGADKVHRFGTFEETREMRLYSTFAVPLIHGWLPARGSAAFGALQRSARTYEDAQNLLFREEELDDKLSRTGLSEDEQGLLQDVVTVKFFLEQTATQLTPEGLDAIVGEIAPGAIAILFRNDHFSTLYKHPRSGQLLQLVTDAGYAGHDEVVWESLEDVTGERSEFFAGDFRPVGNAPASGGNARDGWTDVQDPRSRGPAAGARQQQQHPRQVSGASPQNEPLGPRDNPTSPAAEQEDHDLALALQLQEEEEDRHRREQAARQREESLSEQFLSQQSRSPGSAAVPIDNSTARGRRSQGRTTQQQQTVRPLVPPAQPPRPAANANASANANANAATASGDTPPPTYEQAASGPAYYPPPQHPSHAGAPPPGRTYGGPAPAQPARPGPGPAYGTGAYVGHGPASLRVQASRLIDEVHGHALAPAQPGVRRRQSNGMAPMGPGGVDDGKKDCVAM
ncbi:MAG: hypothetical protein M1832_001284 [Thelocarpon impressellum]|nr:MAG: hypothetical protein M1832_001284 [Thelocarpon impressellum]